MPKYNLFLKCSQIKIYNFNLIIVFELTKPQFAFKCKIKNICELKFGDESAMKSSIAGALLASLVLYIFQIFLTK